MSGEAPSFSATVRPGSSASSSTSSNVTSRNNKPVSMQYKLSDGPPPNISDADRRAKDSNVDSTKDLTKDAEMDKPISIGRFDRGDTS